MNIRFILSIISSIFIIQSTVAATWQTEGERLTYDVGYSFISAGHAEIAFNPTAKDNEYHIIGRAWTHEGIAPLVRIADRLTFKGTHLKNLDYASQFIGTRLFENNYSARKKVLIFHKNNQAIYKNIKDNTGATYRKIEPFSRDLFSALYYLRHHTKNVTVGDSFSLPIVDLTKNYTLKLNILGKDTIEVPWGKVEAYKVQPILHGISNKRKKDKLFIWVSADEERTPLRFEIDMRIGSFVADIIKKDSYNSPSSAPDFLPEYGETSPRPNAPVSQFGMISD